MAKDVILEAGVGPRLRRSLFLDGGDGFGFGDRLVRILLSLFFFFLVLSFFPSFFAAISGTAVLSFVIFIFLFAFAS